MLVVARLVTASPDAVQPAKWHRMAHHAIGSNAPRRHDHQTAESPATAETSVFRTADVIRLTGLSRTSLWRLERRGDFPARRQLSPNAVGWLADEVMNWIRSRPMRGRSA